MKNKKIGVDLGTANTLVYIEDHGIIFNEPTVMSINKDTKEVVEIGYLASKSIGKTPYNIKIIHPLIRGVVADVDLTVAYIKQIFKNLNLLKVLKSSEIYVSSPSDITPVERKALEQVFLNLGAKTITIQYSSRMAAIGTGIDIMSPRGNLVCDIGAGITNIAVITIGDVVLTKSTEVCSKEIDRSIIRNLRTVHHLIIGEKTAEYIKLKIGSLEENPDNNLLEVNGRNIVTGLPTSVIISTLEIKPLIESLYARISDVIVDTLEITPPELSADIVHNGIIITGGGALVKGAKEFFEKNINVPVKIASNPLNNVIEGIAETIK